MKKTKLFKKLNFNITGLIRIYLAELDFFTHKKLKIELNDLLTFELYLILKNLELFDFYIMDKGYSKNIF